MIPWHKKLLTGDVYACPISTRDKTPEVDRIISRLLKACWTRIEKHVKDIFQPSETRTRMNVGTVGMITGVQLVAGSNFSPDKNRQFSALKLLRGFHYNEDSEQSLRKQAIYFQLLMVK